MTIPFKQIPANVRVPLFYAEVSNSQANTGGVTQRALLIGQITSAGAATANVPLRCQGPTDAIAQGGVGSMLALMAAAYLANDSFGEVWYLPLSDAAGATTATGSVAITASPTAAGTLSLYIAGQLVSLAVTAAETAAQCATALAAAINANTNLPVTATAATGTVTLSAVNKGLAGNDIDIRLNYQGAAGGEVTPAGMTVTITAMTGGATNPTLTAALAALVDMPFDFIACPYTDTASLNALQAFLADNGGRWSWNTQVYGHVFTAARGTSGTLTTLGTGRNDQHASIMGCYDSPSPVWVWAAALTGAAAASLKSDPALPLQTVPINGVLAPPLPSRFLLAQRNTLLWDGISTFTVDAGGQVHIENLITTYQQNAFGQADSSYLQVETMFTLMYVLRAMSGMVTSKYAQVKLAADGTRFAPGSAIVTPGMIKADIIAKYQELEFNGYVQNSAAFARAVIVQKNAANPNRVDVLWPGTLINGLRIFALLAQFRLS
ncbi:MAG: phage tail protein [Clostridiaceae bacterium]|nr:phage tail protein [Clostridiaceae bacterium]